MPPALRELLQRELRFEESELASALGPSDVYAADGPVHLGAVTELAGAHPRPELDYPPLAPRDPFPAGRSVFDTLDSAAVLVHHPFDGFAASFERFIAEAADDPAVAAIKLTLYRPGGPAAARRTDQHARPFPRPHRARGGARPRRARRAHPRQAQRPRRLQRDRRAVPRVAGRRGRASRGAGSVYAAPGRAEAVRADQGGERAGSLPRARAHLSLRKRGSPGVLHRLGRLAAPQSAPPHRGGHTRGRPRGTGPVGRDARARARRPRCLEPRIRWLVRPGCWPHTSLAYRISFVGLRPRFS